MSVVWGVAAVDLANRRGCGRLGSLHLAHRLPLARTCRLIVMLARVLGRAAAGVQANEHLEHDHGPLMFEHACGMGLEGLVSPERAHGINPAARAIGVEPTRAGSDAVG
jgi:hypothetical protein